MVSEMKTYSKCVLVLNDDLILYLVIIIDIKRPFVIYSYNFYKVVYTVRLKSRASTVYFNCGVVLKF